MGCAAASQFGTKRASRALAKTFHTSIIQFAPKIASGFDFYGNTVGNESPDFINFVVCNSDASVGPISQAMLFANPAVAVGKAVKIDIPARGNAEFSGAGAILGIGIRNVDGTVELAVRIAPVEPIDAFRSLVVALPDLGTDGIGSERDLVSPQHLVVAQKRERVSFFKDKNAVRFDVLREGLGKHQAGANSGQEHQKMERSHVRGL